MRERNPAWIKPCCGGYLIHVGECTAGRYERAMIGMHRLMGLLALELEARRIKMTGDGDRAWLVHSLATDGLAGRWRP